MRHSGTWPANAGLLAIRPPISPVGVGLVLGTIANATQAKRHDEARRSGRVWTV